MKSMRVWLAVSIALSLVAVAGIAAHDDDHGEKRHHGERLSAKLLGINEVPSVSTPATGHFKARISADGQSIEYELTFGDLGGVIAQSHVHIARKNVNGGIVLWVCQGTVRAPAQVALLTPECPQSGTVTGTWTAANVTPVATQQIGNLELDEVMALIRQGAAYVNIHTAPSPGGEIRGQIRVDGDRDDHDHGDHDRRD